MALTINNCTGFETEGTEEASSTSGSLSFPTTGQRSGGASLLYGSGVGGTFFLPWVADGITDGGSRYITGFAFKIASTLIGYHICQVRDDAGGLIATVSLEATSSALLLRDANNSVLDTSAADSYTDGAWHFIEVYADFNSASGDWEWFIDGVSEESGSGADFTNGNGFGSSSSSLEVMSDSTPVTNFDDVYILSGATASSDRLGGTSALEMPEVLGAYQKTDGGATDQGDALAGGTWANVSETPGVDGTEAHYENTDNLTGSAICDSGDRPGPSGDANIDGDSNIKACKWVYRLKRGSGGGRTHNMLTGNDGGGFPHATTEVSLTTGYQTFTRLVESSAAECPTSTENFQHGFEKSETAGQDIICGEIWAMLLHVPSADGNVISLTATATGIPFFQMRVEKSIDSTAVGIPLFIKKVPQTLSATAVATPTFRKKVPKVLSTTAVGIPLFVKKVSKALSVVATAITTLTTLHLSLEGERITEDGLNTRITEDGVDIRVTEGVGLAEAIALVATAIGIATLSAVATFRRTISATAVGVPSFQKKVFISLSVTAIGIPRFVKKVFTTLTATAVGIASFQIKVLKILSATAVGIATLSTSLTARIALAATAIGIPRFIKKVGKNLSATAVGIPNFTVKVGKILKATAIGIATSVEVFIAGGAAQIALAATAIGVATLSAVATFRRSISATAVGVPLFRIKVPKTLSAVATGIPNIVKKVGVNLRATAIGVPAFTVKVGKILKATAVGVAVLTLIFKAKKTLSAIAVGIPAFQKKVGKNISVTAIGIPKFVKKVGKTLSATAIGIPNFTVKVGKMLSVVATGIATIVSVAVIRITLTATAIGIATLNTHRIVSIKLSAIAVVVPNFVKKVGKILKVTATGIPIIASDDIPAPPAEEARPRWYKGLFAGPGKTAGR